MKQEPMDRKAYIQQIRAQFYDSEQEKSDRIRYSRNVNTYATDNDAEETETSFVRHAFWKGRLLIAVLLFFGFFVLKQTDHPFPFLSEQSIIQQIKTNDQWHKLTGQLKKLENAARSD